MAKHKRETRGVRGWAHLKPGDVITVMDRGEPAKCRVIFCMLEGEDRLHANLEVLEGERKGERFTAVLRGGPEAEPAPEETSE